MALPRWTSGCNYSVCASADVARVCDASINKESAACLAEFHCIRPPLGGVLACLVFLSFYLYEQCGKHVSVCVAKHRDVGQIHSLRRVLSKDKLLRFLVSAPLEKVAKLPPSDMFHCYSTPINPWLLDEWFPLYLRLTENVLKLNKTYRPK